MLGKIEGRRRREQQRMRWLDGIADSMDVVLTFVHPKGRFTDGYSDPLHQITAEGAASPNTRENKSPQFISKS